MSSCWKCGRVLPEGQVECEYGCQAPAPARPMPSLEHVAAIKARDQVAVENAVVILVTHVRDMGAQKLMLPGELDGVKFMIRVEVGL